jgi:predicted DNA-binding transcriptional regulator AlpA
VKPLSYHESSISNKELSLMKHRNKPSIPASARNFDQLPDSASVPAATLAVIFSCSLPTVWRWAKNGTLPKPFKLSNGKTAWNVGEIRAVMAGMKGENND